MPAGEYLFRVCEFREKGTKEGKITYETNRRQVETWLSLIQLLCLSLNIKETNTQSTDFMQDRKKARPNHMLSTELMFQIQRFK